MKLKYKYIHFVEIEQKPKTSVWSCRNNNSKEELGQVKWYGPWRQYCYFITGNSVETMLTVYSYGCLEDIRHFIKTL